MRQPALHTLAALLDRSLTQIAEAAADARTFDRRRIARVSDVWDNNTIGFVKAATVRPAWVGESFARRALRWMADFGVQRHAWVAESALAPGLLPPPPAPVSPDPAWDWNDDITPPWQQPLTADALTPYHLTDCRIVGFQAEYTGDHLHASIELGMRRRYETALLPHGGARLRLLLDGLTALDLTTHSSPRTDLEWRTGDGTVEVLLAPHGRLTAREVTLQNEDRFWHLSEAGIAAAAATPPRRRSLPRRDRRPYGFLGNGAAPLAARVVRRALMDMRFVRSAYGVEQQHVLALCRAFDGAGSAVLAAADRGEQGFRDLVLEWVERGSDPLARWFAETLRENWHGDGPTARWARELATGLHRRPVPPRPVGAPSGTAGLRQVMVEFDDRRTEGLPAEAAVHLAVPPLPGAADGAGSGWELLSVDFADFRQLHLTHEAFSTLAPLRRSRDALTLGTAFALHHGRPGGRP
ncbi:hypothetical protein [Kitasatospora sp. NPDC002040]|uniref:hypothetical protein n=1 Tax=Kitasatospora sp. NPDC002040 TaxID=3154661 RepID=UPI00332C9921